MNTNNNKKNNNKKVLVVIHTHTHTHTYYKYFLTILTFILCTILCAFTLSSNQRCCNHLRIARD